MAAQMEIVDQLKAWIKTGVSPLGAQVRRIEGRWETPLSSSKKIHAFRRRAFFLPPATFDQSTVSLSPDCALWLAWPAAARSSLSIPVSSTHVPGDSEHRSTARRQALRGEESTNQCQTRAPLLPFAVLPRPAAVAAVPTSVFDLLDQHLAVRHCRRASTARTSDLRSGGSPAIRGQSAPESSCQRRTFELLASAAVPSPRNPDAAEGKFPCSHCNITPITCHSITRDSVDLSLFPLNLDLNLNLSLDLNLSLNLILCGEIVLPGWQRKGGGT